MKAELDQIEHGDILLGIMHASGVALHLEPGRGSLYVNARRFTDDLDKLTPQVSSWINMAAAPPRQHTDAFRFLDVDVHRFGSPVAHSLVFGAMAWLGDPDVLPSELDVPDQIRGALIAYLVLERQKVIENTIYYKLLPKILLDQTQLADVILGTAPSDGRFCWLVDPELASMLEQEGQVLHHIGMTNWWQQSEQLDRCRDKLVRHPTLERIANRLGRP